MNRPEPVVKQLAKIRSKPYRRVIIRPNEYQDDRIGKLLDLIKIIQETRVSIIGWDFPFVGNKEDRVQGSDFVGMVTEFDDIQEYWEFHKSGQFVFFEWFHELHPEAQKVLKAPFNEDAPRLSVVNQIFGITEILEFLARLTQRLELTNGVYIEIFNGNVGGTVLATDWRRHYPIRTEQNLETDITLKKNINYLDALSKNRVIAAELIQELFSYYRFDMRIDVIRSQQDEYYSLRHGHDDFDKRFDKWPEEEQETDAPSD